MRGACIHLGFEIRHILVERGRLRVLLRIAGAIDLQIRPTFANVTHQITGMGEHAGRFALAVAVSAQCEHAAHFRLIEHGERLVDIPGGEVLCGQVGDRVYAVFRVYGVRDACGGRAVADLPVP